jgi:dUTP pyrophosphatase
MKKEDKIELLIKKVHKDAELPDYNYPTDIGLDLVSVEDICFLPMEQKKVRTGIIVKIPDGHVGLVRDRSGIVSKMNIHTVAGTFDPGYRGELSIFLVNFSDKELEIEKGMKIAQLLIIPVVRVDVKEVKTLDKTLRGDKGFGSTGL